MEDPNGPNQPQQDAPPIPPGVPMARPLASPCASPQPEILLAQHPRRIALLDVAIVIGAFVLPELALGIILTMIHGPLDASSTDELTPLGSEWLVPMLCGRALIILGAVALVLRSRRQSPASVGVTFRSRWINLLLGGASTIAAYGLIFAWLLIAQVYFPELAQFQENADRLHAMVFDLGFLGFAGLTVVVSIYEEILFRGFIMTRLRRATSSWTLAVLLSSVLFVLPHAIDQTPAALPPIAILSLVFSLVTIWRRSLVPAIVGHFLFNFSQFVGLYLQNQQMT